MRRYFPALFGLLAAAALWLGAGTTQIIPDAGDLADFDVTAESLTVTGNATIGGTLGVTGPVTLTAGLTVNGPPLVIGTPGTMAIDINTSLTGVATAGIDLSGLTLDTDDVQILFKGTGSNVDENGFFFSRQFYASEYFYGSNYVTRNTGNNMTFDLQAGSARFLFRDRNDNNIIAINDNSHWDTRSSGGLTLASYLNLYYLAAAPPTPHLTTGSTYIDTNYTTATGNVAIKVYFPALGPEPWAVFTPSDFEAD